MEILSVKITLFFPMLPPKIVLLYLLRTVPLTFRENKRLKLLVVFLEISSKILVMFILIKFRFMVDLKMYFIFLMQGKVVNFNE